MVKTFFITGLGRSGTQWLAALLGKSPNAFVQHEWWRYRYGALLPMHTRDPKHFDRDYLEIRINETRQAIETCGKPIYGEVNSKARYFLPDLMQAFRPIVVSQLVRDGRDVVRSCHSRQTYTGHDLHPPIEPTGGSYRQEWPTYNRFQKLCWYWSWTTDMVDYCTFGEFMRLEDLVSPHGWDIIERDLLDPLGMKLERKVWEEQRSMVVDNSPTSPQLPHWTEWDDWHREEFDRISGEMLARFGYKWA